MSIFTNLILPVLFSVLFIYLIIKLRFFQVDELTKKITVSLFIIKVISGTILTLIYTYYYTDYENSDIYKYFDDSYLMYKSLASNPIDYIKMVSGIGCDNQYFHDTYFSKMAFWYKEWDYHLYNDNRTVIRFNAIVRLFSFGSIHVHTVVMSFLSFIGLFSIYKLFINFIKDKNILLIFSIFLLPSVLFWTSGVLKEGLLIFAFGLMIYKFYNLLNKFTILDFSIFAISVFILSLVKFYILLAAVPGIIALIWLKYTDYKQPLLKFLIVHLSLFIIAINIDYLLLVLHKKQKDFIVSLDDLSLVGSYFKIPTLEPNAWSLIKNIPIAIFNTMFRPFILEANSVVVLVAAFENLIIIFAIILSLIFFKLKGISNKSWFWFCVFFTIIVFALCGLVTPVMGALVRYKVPALPFLFLIFVFLIDYERLKKYIPFIPSYKQ